MPLHRFDDMDELHRAMLSGTIPGGLLCQLEFKDENGNVLASIDDWPAAQIGDEIKQVVINEKFSSVPISRTGMVADAFVDGLPWIKCRLVGILIERPGFIHLSDV